MKKLILASSSPRRKEILELLGLSFDIIPSDYEEDMTLDMEPKKLAKHLSRGKAEDVAQKVNDSIVIGCDTFISLRGKVLGKPHTEEQATKTLKEISGNTLDVVSGLTVVDTDSNKSESIAQVTKVYIKELADQEIDSYVATGEPLDKAGAFAIQGLGAIFVEKIEGDFYNVMGLPLFSLAGLLKKFGINPLEIS